ncbi:MAG: AraC family transcriptional regulator ligand-binding domain-containing protein [Planctomycetota bacterium]
MGSNHEGRSVEPLHRSPLAEESPRHVLSSVVAHTANYALARGVDLRQIREATAVECAQLIDPLARLPDLAPPLIWRLIQRYDRSEGLPLHMARGTSFAYFGPWLQAVEFAPDLRSALLSMQRFQAVLSDRLSLRFVESGDEARMEAHHPADELDAGHTAEHGLAMAKRAIVEVVGASSALVRVELSHAPLGHIETYRAFFGVPVLMHRARNALVFRRAALDQPTAHRDPSLFRYASHNLELLLERWSAISPRDRLRPLRQAIAHNAKEAIFSAEALAQRLNMSLRALQRRVLAEGYTVRGLLDEERNVRARTLLADASRSVEEVATLVGYSDERSFRRAFQRWTGTTPAQYRR